MRSLSHQQSRAQNDYASDKNHVINVVPPSITLVFLAKTKQKHKSTSPSAHQVKNWRKTIRTEEKLCKISWLEKGEQIADLRHNPRIAHSGICTLHDNKGKVILLQAQCGPEGAKRYSTTLPWLRHEKGVSGQQHTLAALNPLERSTTHFTGGWVDPRVGLDWQKISYGIW